jgi:antitoxin (DNA-binding transcriptional repressor) of toxin-antitoxin stability system
MNKTIALGAVALGTAGVLAAGGGLAATRTTATRSAAAVASAVPAGYETVAAKTLDPVGHQTSYVQRGGTVTVYRNGAVVATVTPASARFGAGSGTLKLTVVATKAFTFTPAQFIWEDPDGGDHEAVNGKREITIPAGTTRTVTIGYQDVGKGDVIWTPGPDSVVGAWTVTASTINGETAALADSYVQQGHTVRVFRNGHVVARVTPKSATRSGGHGRLVVSIAAEKAFSLTTGEFIWEDPDGGDHDALNGKKVVKVAAGSTATVTIQYKKVGRGDVIWAPTAGTLAGGWLVTGN